MEKDIVLRMTNISKSFPGVKALQNVDFALRKGEIHALMGENSTLINVDFPAPFSPIKAKFMLLWEKMVRENLH